MVLKRRRSALQHFARYLEPARRIGELLPHRWSGVAAA